MTSRLTVSIQEDGSYHLNGELRPISRADLEPKLTLEWPTIKERSASTIRWTRMSPQAKPFGNRAMTKGQPMEGHVEVQSRQRQINVQPSTARAIASPLEKRNKRQAAVTGGLLFAAVLVLCF